MADDGRMAKYRDMYHSCPIACPEEGTYDEYDDPIDAPQPAPPSIPIVAP